MATDLLGLPKADPDHSHDEEKPGMDKLGMPAPKSNKTDVWGKDEDS